MNAPNPIDLLFAGMDKLSPGNDSLSLYVLRSLPRHRFEVVADAGCGAGRQTFVLADELKTPIDAVDSYQPFLDRQRLLNSGMRRRGRSRTAMPMFLVRQKSTDIAEPDFLNTARPKAAPAQNRT